MEKTRIPPHWRNLRPGDIIHSRLPFHRLQAIAAQLPDHRFEFLPSPRGYHVRCEQVRKKKPELRIIT